MNIERILAKARQLGLRGAGGFCGAAAVAINNALFDGQGNIVAAANEAMLNRGRLVGHVAVQVGDAYWDYEGAYKGSEGEEDFLAWGMLDPDDPSHGLTEKEAEEVVLVVLDTEDLEVFFTSSMWEQAKRFQQYIEQAKRD